ncbi:hypothetical protein ACI79G_16065 [Geodermatophilus sp. SYSU D00779]
MDPYRTRRRILLALGGWGTGVGGLFFLATYDVLVSALVALGAAGLAAAVGFVGSSVGRDLWRQVWLVVGVHPLRSPQQCLNRASRILFSATAISWFDGKVFPHARVRVVLAPADLLALTEAVPRAFINEELTRAYCEQASAPSPAGRQLEAYVVADADLPRGRFRVEPAPIEHQGRAVSAGPTRTTDPKQAPAPGHPGPWRPTAA